ncbi:hypothetical protein PACTADRAFT_44803 [Pachysolen tannophilus NRRL Y-2460]|uniref:Ornithine decarboxylase n=1 Tax=Pachysolen tannophilus NRRL Y-2460 TaxID=669874 RepID=A0A1E4TRS0_PACTA|nr:hypothetical protein PACTADRAFT_44803 [Pachysolen tannophilus NRRL Y-2460]
MLSDSSASSTSGIANNETSFSSAFANFSSGEIFDQNSKRRSRLAVGEELKNHIMEIDPNECLAGEEDSFFVCDLGEVVRLYRNWKLKLPRVQPFYAIKCNNDSKVLTLLDKLGCNFDCASKGEIDKILKMGISPEKIVYANPCKSNSFIRYSKQVDVNLTTFDNFDELYKIKKLHPNCKLLLRIATNDQMAQCPLSIKFGSRNFETSVELMKLCKSLDLNLVGVAFHVGSGFSDLDSLRQAIKDSKELFVYAKSHLGIDMNILDIGGGFTLETFEESSSVANESLDENFPENLYPNLKIIAEPGRYMVSSAFTLACHIIARRGITNEKENTEKAVMLYLNDGLYGNLNCILYDHQKPVARILTRDGEFLYYKEYENSLTKRYPASIWGPTCDGLDCISEKTYLSHLLNVGDWMFFDNIGAYTSVASTSFNGFTQTASVKYVCSE